MKQLHLTAACLLFFCLTARANPDEIWPLIQNNEYTKLTSFLTSDKILIEIQTSTMRIMKSFYSARQVYYLLEKFNPLFKTEKLESSAQQGNGDTLLAQAEFSVLNTKKNMNCRLNFQLNLIRSEKGWVINQISIIEREQ